MERGRGIRINRYLAMCGVGARRAVERLVVEGRVDVDGEVVADLAFRVPSSATVCVDGRAIELPRRFRYVAYYKRPGVLTTAEDRFHRKTVRDELPQQLRGLRAVGRLDADTEGLLLLTDDGSFAQRVAHPSFGVIKRYVVALKGRINKYEVAALERGIGLLDGRVGKVKVDSVGRRGTGSSVTLSVGYGRKRMIRQMFAALGKEVVSLRRVAVGPVTLAGLRPGRWRDLTREEVTALRGS